MDVIESPRTGPRARFGFFLLVLIVVMGLGVWVLAGGKRSGPPSSTLATPADPEPSRTSGGFLPLWPQGPPPPASLPALVAPVKPPHVVDPARGAVIGINGFSIGPQGKYTVTEIGDGYVVTARTAISGSSSPAPPTDAYLVTGDLSTARPIASGDSIAVGADGRSVLAAAGARVTRHALDGTRREEVMLPKDRTLAHETVAGFVLAVVPGGTWEIWDPRSGEVRHRFPQLFAASGSTVAYGSYDRGISVLNLATGARLDTEIPDRELTVYQAALSRDGRYLATQLTNRGQWQHVIVVFDTKLALWVAMPGTPFAALNQMTLAWSGSTLVLARTDQPAIILWTPGEPVVYSAPIT
ncbi:MAG TPA: hypothetical protein VFC19_38355 [Candidatus Limnocylindrales bacterium]|nr:hypothetical protein [Candidatus Limnocylindrales bacterium]